MSGSDLCIPRNETARPRYFQNRIIMFHNVLSLNFHIHVSARDLYIPRIGLPRTDPGNIKIVHSYETGNEAMQFQFWKYMFSIFWYSAARYKTVRQIDSYMFFEWLALSPISIVGDYLRCKVKIITRDIVNSRMNNICVCSQSLNINL